MATILVVANFEFEKVLRLDPDTWMHIKYGESILQTGHWPRGDIYSFTAHGVFRMAFEWGGEVLIALAYRVGALRGLEILLLLLSSAVALLIYYYAWMRCQNSKAALLAAIIVLPLAAMTFTVRPQLLGFIFVLITLICLERYRKGQQKNLWVLPPLFLIWINTHGSWALGLFIVGLYWASGFIEFSVGGLRAERWRLDQRIHIALVFLLSVTVLPINPYGGRLVVYPIDMAFFQPVGVANVQEWQPIPLGFWESKLLLILLLAFIAAIVAYRPSYRLEEIGLFLFTTYATILHFRFVFLFAIVAAPLIGSVLARWIDQYNPAIDKYALNAVLMLLVLIGMVVYFPSQSNLAELVAKSFPVKAVEYLRQHPVPGPMFNDYSFGGYLLWSMGPEHKVFIDGRADLYEETGAFSDYIRIVDIKPNVLALLQSYGIQSCMVGPRNALATLLSSIPGWKRVYQDNVAAIYVRTSAANSIAPRSTK